VLGRFSGPYPFLTASLPFCELTNVRPHLFCVDPSTTAVVGVYKEYNAFRGTCRSCSIIAFAS